MGHNVSNACPNACKKKQSYVQPTTNQKFKGKICQNTKGQTFVLNL